MENRYEHEGMTWDMSDGRNAQNKPWTIKYTLCDLPFTKTMQMTLNWQGGYKLRSVWQPQCAELTEQSDTPNVICSKSPSQRQWNKVERNSHQRTQDQKQSSTSKYVGLCLLVCMHETIHTSGYMWRIVNTGDDGNVTADCRHSQVHTWINAYGGGGRGWEYTMMYKNRYTRSNNHCREYML